MNGHAWRLRAEGVALPRRAERNQSGSGEVRGGGDMRQAERPFDFVAASYLIRIRQERAWTLAELTRHLGSVSDDSIFYHTFQSLEAHHYTIFSNDFAQWCLTACNEAVLAEELSAVDLRDIVAVKDLRKVLTDQLEAYLSTMPQAGDRPAFEPFYFSEALETVVFLDARAFTLMELAAGIRGMSNQTLHYHFINSRVRLRLQTNDFSNWIDGSLGLPELARKIDRIDFYTNTLDGIRRELVQAMESWPQ